MFDENLTNDVEIIKSVFKKMVGKYDLFSELEKTNIHHEMI